jgi:predicted PurR-regulated permease PerM
MRSAGPLTAIGGLVLVLVAVLALHEVASLVVPVMFGLFIALTAWPMVGALERRGVRHAFALAATILVVLAVGLAAACVAALSVGALKLTQTLQLLAISTLPLEA